LAYLTMKERQRNTGSSADANKVLRVRTFLRVRRSFVFIFPPCSYGLSWWYDALCSNRISCSQVLRVRTILRDHTEFHVRTVLRVRRSSVFVQSFVIIPNFMLVDPS